MLAGIAFCETPRRNSHLKSATPNQVVSKCFVKKQQMQWTPKGAHLLLQRRTRMLDGDLDAVMVPTVSGLLDLQLFDALH
jgi:hypothetical protein